MKTPTHRRQFASEAKISLKITGFSRQQLIPIEDIVRSIDTLPPGHLAGLREISYEPEQHASQLAGNPGNDRRRSVKARYNQTQSRIDVYSFDNSAMFFHVLFHEIGHFVYSRVINSQTRREWATRIFMETTSITRYGETNASEDFAETYGIFLRDPDRLKHQIPEKYAFMNDSVFYPKV